MRVVRRSSGRKGHWLAGTALLTGAALLWSGAAVAQSGPAGAASGAGTADNPEVVVVTGSIRSAQAASIAAKREAENLVDVAAADTVGRFPDQNTAAALARLPAVAVQRDQGQERYVQVRGAPNRWISVSFDGIPVIGVDEGGSTRAFRFDAVPAVMLSSAAINKSLTPDITAEAIAANVDLRTWSPLSADGFDLQGDIGLGEMNLGGGEQRQGSIRAAWSNGTIGLVAGASTYRREQVTDNREVGAWSGRVPTELDIRNYQLIRENNGYFLGAEYRVNDRLTLSVKGIVTEFTDTEDRDQYEFRLDRAPGFATAQRSGDLVNVPVRGTFNEGDYFTRYEIVTGSLAYEGERFDLSATINHTASDNTTFLPLIQVSASSSQNVSLNYNLADPNFPIVTLFRTVPGTPPTRGAPLAAIDQTAFASVTYIPVLQDSFSDSWSGRIDGTWRLRDGLDLAAGVFWSDRALDGFTFATSNAVNLTGRITLGNFVTSEPWTTGFPLGTTFNLIDNQRLRAAVLAALPGAPTFVPGQTYDPSRDVPDINRYDLEERLLAVYGRVSWDFGATRVVAGLRVERFEVDNRGTVQTGSNRFERLQVSTEKTDLFPSINVRHSIGDNWVVRASVQRGIARPSFGEVRVGASVNDTTSPGTINGGNPALEPEYTWGTDFSIEYYPNRSSILALSVYRRWVSGVLYSNTQTVGSDAFNSNGIDRSSYQLTSTFNGEDGELTGVELSYQQQFSWLPEPFDGLGVQGNLALIDGSFDTVQRRGIGFPGTSDRIINASIYYEKYGVSARISYQHRTEWLDTLGGLGVGSSGDEFRDGYGNLDVALRYRVGERLTLFADFSNLTDELYVAYLGDPGRPTEVEQIGTRYMVGVRFSY